MKLIRNLTLGALLTGVSLGAHAALWTETKIKAIQVASGVNSIQVYLETPVDFDACNHVNYGQKAQGLSFRQTDPNFDQIYSAILAAKHSGDSFMVMNRGTCASQFWAVQPIVRF